MAAGPWSEAAALPLAVGGREGGGYGAKEAECREGRRLRRKPSLPPLASGNNAVLTAGIIIADVVGAGILSMGSAVAKFGWLLGAAVILLLLAMNVHISLLVWRVRMGCPAVFTYLDLASVAFARAPPWQRQIAEMTTLVSQQAFLFLAMTLYCLSVGRCLGTMFYNELRLCLPPLVLIGLLAFCPVHLSQRSMGQNQSLIALNVATIVGSALIPLAHMAGRGTGETRLPGSSVRAVEDLSFVGVMSGLEVMTFAFTSQFMLVEIMAEMENPREFPKAYAISAPFQAIMFLIAGLGTYYFMGNHANSILGENLPFGLTFRVAAACLLVHMLITFLIKGVVFCRWVHQVWDPQGVNDTSRRGWGTWGATVLGTTALCWFVVQIVPFFSDFMSLLGATLVPVSCYLVPITLYIRWLHDFGSEEDHPGPVETVIIAAEVLLCLLLMTMGTYFALENLQGKWSTYGPPFACHCRNIWATCECSPDHPGMEHCRKTQ